MKENNWQTIKLGDVCKIKTGKKDVNQGNTCGKYPFFTCAKEHTYSDGYSFDTEALLVAGNGDVGNVSYYKGKFEAYQRTYVLSDFSGISLRFLCLFLDGFLKDTVSKQKLGNTIPYIKMGMLSNFVIPLPPLPEQKRIVKILDEVFEEVGKAKGNAEKNLRNSRELFESYLQSVFENRGEGWEEKRLGEIYDVRDGTHDSPKYQEKGFALVTSKNLKRNGLNFNNIKYISEKDYEKINDRSKVDKGDILLAMIGTIGSPIVVEIEPDFAIKNVALFKIPKDQSNYFLRYYLDSKIVFDKMARESKGTTQKFVGLGYLRGFTIPLPPLSEQKAIVKKLDALSEETKKLEEIYKKEIADLEELKKSVLQKAFRGEL